MLRNAYYFIRCWLSDIIYWLCKKETRELISQDAYAISGNEKKLKSLNQALMSDPFRNIFYYRLKREGKLIRALSHIDGVILPRCKSVEITGGTFGGGYKSYTAIV